MILDKRLIRYNYSARGGGKITYIVVHDTGNARVGAGALNHFKYFNSANRNASAHYFVDDKGIVQCVEDCLSAWHCGDGKGRYGITNRNSIGVEICINSDGNYNMAVLNAVDLVRELMAFYKVPLQRVVRHFDASGKLCPASMSANNWQGWKDFKNCL